MKTVFMGTPRFAVPALKALSESIYRPELVITQPDRPRGRRRKLLPPEVKLAAEELSIPVFQPYDVNLEENLKIIENIKPDLIITVAYGGFLKRGIRKLPPFGCINLHPSLLPLYRGAAPINYALFNGDKKTGISIFRIVAKMDAGPLLWKREIAINEVDNYTTLSEKLSLEGAKDLLKLLPKIDKNEIELIVQDEELVSYSSKLTKEDMFLNWNSSADDLSNKIRGLAEYPGAVAGFRNKRIKIIEVEIQKKSRDKPGTIVKIDNNTDFSVATDTEDLLIKRLQPEGKKIMSSQAYNLGARLSVGERFTDGF